MSESYWTYRARNMQCSGILQRIQVPAFPYLKGVDRDRYDAILERVGLEPGAVEGELVV